MNPALRRSAAHVFVESLDAPVLSADDLHHLARVLRLRDREVVSVSDGAGEWRSCRFAAGGELVVDGEIMADPAPAPPITVGFAIPKGDRPEWIVQKLTEIGVDTIVVLHAERSIVRWEAGKAARHIDRLGKVTREAAMQSRRTRLPQLIGPVSVSDLLAGGSGGVGQARVVSPVALAEPDGDLLELTRPTVLIGPEGGWTDAEREAVGVTVGLGDTILRVETAAIVVAARLTDQRERARP